MIEERKEYSNIRVFQWMYWAERRAVCIASCPSIVSKARVLILIWFLV